MEFIGDIGSNVIPKKEDGSPGINEDGSFTAMNNYYNTQDIVDNYSYSYKTDQEKIQELYNNLPDDFKVDPNYTFTPEQQFRMGLNPFEVKINDDNNVNNNNGNNMYWGRILIITGIAYFGYKLFKNI